MHTQVGGPAGGATALTFNAGTTALAVQNALNAETGLTGNVSVTGPNGGPFLIEFKGALANSNVAQLLVPVTGGLTASVYTLKDGSGNESQTLTLSSPPLLLTAAASEADSATIVAGTAGAIKTSAAASAISGAGVTVSATGLVTVTVTAAETFAATDPVTIAGLNDAALNGNFTIAAINSTTSFTFQDNAAATGSAYTSFGVGTAGATAVDNLVTINTTAANNFIPGELVTIATVGVAGYNGAFTILSTPTSSSFTYNDTAVSAVALAASGGGTATNNQVTITTGTNNLTPGQQVTIAGVSVAGYNGIYTVLATPTATTFTYLDPTLALAASTVAGTATVYSGTAGTITPAFGGVLGSAITLTPGSSPTAAQVAISLNAIPALSGNITVLGADGGPFTVVFNGALAGVQVPALIPGAASGNADLTDAVVNQAGGSSAVQTLTGVAAGTTTLTYGSAPTILPLGYVGTTTVPLATTGATEVGGLVTITVASTNAFVVGQPVTIAGVSVAGYNGSFIINSVPSATTFTYVDSTTGLAVSTVAGSAVATGQVITAAVENVNTVTVTVPSTAGLVVGQLITIANMTPGGFNGTYPVTAILNGTQFQYTNPTPSLGTATGFGVVEGTSAAAVQANLSTIAALNGNITVLGANGGPYTIVFNNALNNQAIPTLVSGTVATATILATRDGGTDSVAGITIIDGNITTGGTNTLSTTGLTMTGGSVTTGSGALDLFGNLTYNSGAQSIINGNLNLGGANRTIAVNDGPNIDDLVISALVSGGPGGSYHQDDPPGRWNSPTPPTVTPA